MPNLIPKDYGWIELIIGPMYSGKTSELIRRLTLAQIAKQKVAVLKPDIDNRFSEFHIVSRQSGKMPCTPIDPIKFSDEYGDDILTLTKDCSIVGIDEAQFFHNDLISICDGLAKRGKRVIIAGLDSDFMRKPFSTVTRLISVSEYVDKMLAVCVVCGNPAHLNKRIVSSRSRVVVGDTEAYEVRCRDCFWVKN